MSGHVVAYRLEEKQQFWKRILIVDDEVDVTTTFRAGIEDSNNYNNSDKRIKVYTSNNIAAALSEFKPNFYDLLLVDINMPNMNGFELSERILAIDINARICFTSRDHSAIDGVKLKLNSNFFVLILR